MVGNNNPIRKFRQQANLTQKQLARLSGCSAATISNIERDFFGCSIQILSNVCGALGYSVDVRFESKREDAGHD